MIRTTCTRQTTLCGSIAQRSFFHAQPGTDGFRLASRATCGQVRPFAAYGPYDSPCPRTRPVTASARWAGWGGRESWAGIWAARVRSAAPGAHPVRAVPGPLVVQVVQV